MLKALLKFFTGGDAKTAAVSKAGAVQTDLAGFVELVEGFPGCLQAFR